MIRISRIEGEEIKKLAGEIVPNLVFEDEGERNTYLTQLSGAIQAVPESVMVIVAKKDEELVGVIIAQAQSSYIFISQFWSSPSNSWKVSDEMFLRVVMWASVLGKSSVRGETKRNVEAGFRRFGFTEVSKTVEYKIPQGVATAMASKLRETMHGKPVQTAEVSNA